MDVEINAEGLVPGEDDGSGHDSAVDFVGVLRAYDFSDLSYFMHKLDLCSGMTMSTSS